VGLALEEVAISLFQTLLAVVVPALRVLGLLFDRDCVPIVILRPWGTRAGGVLDRLVR